MTALWGRETLIQSGPLSTSRTTASNRRDGCCINHGESPPCLPELTFDHATRRCRTLQRGAESKESPTYPARPRPMRGHEASAGTRPFCVTAGPMSAIRMALAGFMTRTSDLASICRVCHLFGRTVITQAYPSDLLRQFVRIPFVVPHWNGRGWDCSHAGARRTIQHISARSARRFGSMSSGQWVWRRDLVVSKNISAR